jgi:hypothetical protein
MRNRYLAFYVWSALTMMIAVQPVAGQTHFQTGLHLTAGLLQGDFKQNTGNDGFGLTAEFLYAPSQSILGIGADVGFLIYGSETQRQPLLTTIPDVKVKVTTNNSILLSHLLLRVQNKQGKLRPYIEGVLGLNYLFTQTQINGTGDWDDDDHTIASTTNFDDTAISYGMGGGLMWQVYERSGASCQGNGKPLSVLLDLRGRYMIGGEAQYLKKGSIRREGGQVFYDAKQSATDMVTIHLGATICF